jgi:putative thiamine transport system permease protein
VAAPLQQLIAAARLGSQPALLRYLPAVTLLVFLGPVVAGLLGTVLPAFGYLPVLGGERFSLEPWRQLAVAPGIGSAVRVTLVSGVLSTLLALGLTVLVFAAGHGTTGLVRVKRAMTPLLAVPHLATAVGLAFLIAPSGWLARLAAPWAGWQTPPDVALVQDHLGLALTLGLAVKETPFLVLMTFGALGQVRADDQLRLARTLGYGPVQAWLKVVLPLVYPQIRLPVYAVLAYSLSVVDMAIVLGPTTPPTLAPLVLRWFNDPDLGMRFQAAAGAGLQLALVVLAIGLWRAAESALGWLARPWLIGGGRGGRGTLVRAAAWTGLVLLFGLSLGSLLSLAVWSVAGRWRFPDAWPEQLSLDRWALHAGRLLEPAMTTLVVGAIAALLALALVAGCLENESRRQRQPGFGALTLVYLPLLAPQIGFLFGVQVLLVWTRLDGGWLGLIWSHLLFVLPYVFLALADPYRSLDPRYARSALALGKSRWVVWTRIKLIMLLRPLLVALAVGFAVSVAQYLPTLFAGGGRFATLTTEALGLSAGGDRRLVGQLALTLAVLPLLGFGLALAVPAWRFRDRRAMRVGA